jgi:hypothetical protein
MYDPEYLVCNKATRAAIEQLVASHTTVLRGNVDMMERLFPLLGDNTSEEVPAGEVWLMNVRSNHTIAIIKLPLLQVPA